MTRLAALSLCLAATAALAGGPIYLQSLSATSGTGADAVLDGDPRTGWRPLGDARNEGVLLRFEAPVDFDGAEVQACGDSRPFVAAAYVNASKLNESAKVSAGKSGALRLFATGVRSLFVRVESGEGACIAGLALSQKGKPLDVKPPRSVKGAVSASSVLTPPDAYHPGFLFDGRLDFGWVEGAKGTGEGETVTLTLESPVEVVSLELWNGYQRSADHFKKNARARQLSLSVDGAAPVLIEVKDATGAQKLALPKAATGKSFALTVKKTYAGSRYPDLVLSELRLWDKAGPLTVRTTDVEERRKAIEAELLGTALEKTVNRTFESVCGDDDGSRQLKLRTNHTFVWYETREQSDDRPAVNEVFDGAWVPAKRGKAWSAVDLFGRRHRVESKWEPYRGDRTKDATVVSGGKVDVARVADLGKEEFAKLVAEWSAGPSQQRVACVETTGPKSFEELAKREALVVRGTAMLDLLWAAP